ncbi:hypothetical protein PIB30_101454 [Stylosanthes scabra]|uniref:Uncharacterized protein n=1 Tax=Stylosanthes scabra TaxID=79078 RepID=A0ABU6R013_9FABA|nr:hypothetical protein [Stylosanthes scabra]
MQGIPVTMANLVIHGQREEANKGKAREIVPDSEDSKDTFVSAIAWSFIHHGIDTPLHCGILLDTIRYTCRDLGLRNPRINVRFVNELVNLLSNNFLDIDIFSDDEVNEHSLLNGQLRMVGGSTTRKTPFCYAFKVYHMGLGTLIEGSRMPAWRLLYSHAFQGGLRYFSLATLKSEAENVIHWQAFKMYQ